MKHINIALIGAGRMGQAHARILASLPECKVLTVIDAVAENAQQAATTLNATASSNIADALENPSIDAVVVTTPTPTHADIIVAAARAGKAIFCEKPVAHTLDAARRAVQTVEDHGVPCQIGFQRRYDPAYIKAKSTIDAGALGKLEGFRGVGRDPTPPSTEFLKTSGGLFVDMGIHDLDLARFLIGEVEEVYAIGDALAQPALKPLGLFDTAVATLRFANGAIGTLEVALRTSYGYDIRTEILGEHGRVHIERDRRPDLSSYDQHGAHHDRPRNFEERFAEAYAAQIVAFAKNLVAGQAVSPTPRDAWHSLRLALAAQHALETGQVVQVQRFGESL